MNSGMYAALSGNSAAMRRLDVLSNNLANANTVGFKGDRIQFESVLAQAQNPSEGPVFSSERFSTDFSQGTLQATGNSLDVALQGEGFLVVNTPQGVAYTRQGNLHRGADGKLLTAQGYQVQGTNGAPVTINGSKVEISQKGEVKVDGTPAGTLRVVDFPKPYALTKQGEGLFLPSDPQVAPGPSTALVEQGSLEGSNVKVIVEMARMIEASRYFESCSKAVKSYDDMAAKAANDLGKV